MSASGSSDAPAPAADAGGGSAAEGRRSAPSLRITEIFHSIQGESTWAGAPCTFVRLTGCPLRCVWCDTEYSFHGGELMTLAEILERVENEGCPLVEITGGEPLVHPNAFVLAEQLLDAGYTVLVETSGAVDIAAMDPRAHVIMDIKCPGSGEESRNLWNNLDHLDGRDEVKFVIADKADYEWTRGVIRERGLDRRVGEGSIGALLMSPVWGEMDDRELAEWILEDGLQVRYQTQLHKHLWGPDTKGV